VPEEPNVKRNKTVTFTAYQDESSGSAKDDVHSLNSPQGNFFDLAFSKKEGSRPSNRLTRSATLGV
jgi:hypothetical protein